MKDISYPLINVFKCSLEISLTTFKLLLHFVFCLSSSCVPHVVSFSGLPILDAPSVFSNVYI